MPLIQVRDVPEATVNALKVRAAEHGQTLTSYLRGELDRLAARPSNADIAARSAQRDRQGGHATRGEGTDHPVPLNRC